MCQHVHHVHDLFFSLEVIYGSLLNTTAHMHRRRVGARGNATTFPMLRHPILAELMKLDQDGASGKFPELLRTGEDLKHVLQVLLKTNDEDERDNLKHLIHQARVRRHVVVNLIPHLKELDTARINMSTRRESKQTRVCSRKTECRHILIYILQYLPSDNTLDNIRVQKAATPVDAMQQDLDATKARRSC